MEYLIGGGLILGLIAAVMGLRWLGREYGPSGLIRPKTAPPFPVKPNTWIIRRRKQFEGEQERDNKGELIWYQISTHTDKAEAYRILNEEIVKRPGILIRVHPVYVNEEG